MRETKKQLVDRIRRSGGELLVNRLWVRIRELEKGPPPLTRPEAWDIARREPMFAPPEQLKPEKDAGDSTATGRPANPTDSDKHEQPPPIQYDGKATWQADVRWCYENYDRIVHFQEDGRVLVEPRHAKTRAPSEGAKGLIKWAAQNRTKFIELCQRVFKDDEDTKANEARDEDKSIREVRDTLKRFLDLAAA